MSKVIKEPSDKATFSAAQLNLTFLGHWLPFEINKYLQIRALGERTEGGGGSSIIGLCDRPGLI